ncbi:MAG: magnesium transporter [Spirochaetia bacterium]|jgi:magnesium transporter|nr:magnesium transporter [Spirochaetia bacterium]
MSTWIKHLREYEEILDPLRLRKLLEKIDIVDLTEEWRVLTEEEETLVFLHLPLETKIDLITELTDPQQERILHTLSEKSKKELFKKMEPDDLVDIVQSVNPDIRNAVWETLSDEVKRETLFLLRFDEDDAAGLMNPRYIAIRSSINVSQALEFIRKNADKVEFLYNIYVLDNLQRLIGIVSVQDILSADNENTISNIMDEKVISVREDTDQEEAVKIMEANDLVSLPVVDQNNVLLGDITFDDALDVIREEQTEDVYKMGAMSGAAESYMTTSVWGLVKKRVPWLIVLLLVGTITTNVLHHYEGVILSAAFLFIFMPVITQTGGNAGSQSSTLMIRGLATGEIQFREIGIIMSKELLVGIMMGFITGVVIILRSIILPPGIGIEQGLIIGSSLIFVVLISNMIGTLAPLLIHRMGYDPTVMSGPLMATVIDVAGLTIYFEIARFILKI